MSNKTMVSVPRELLQDLIDSAQLEVDERVRAYGESYRPHVLRAQRKVVSDANAILTAPAEDARAVVDDPVAWLGSELAFTSLADAKEYAGYKDGVVTPLYRHPQRPVVMPKRRTADSPEINQNGHLWWREEKAADFNACLDEFARLNPN